MSTNLREKAAGLLRGAYDLHVHTDPDIHLERAQDDLEYARAARDAGMAGAVLKNHYTLTADRAALVRKVVPGVAIFGSICLDSAVGGINPAAVEAALRFLPGQPLCKVVWMPTITARHYTHRKPGANSGHTILDEHGDLIPTVHDILDLILQADCILATGHLSVLEKRTLLKEAYKRGLQRIIVTHVDAPYLGLDIETQQEFNQYALIEHSFVQTLPTNAGVSIAKVVQAIRAVGAERCIISTDLGQAYNPDPVAGLHMFILALLHADLSEGEVAKMVQSNPAWLLNDTPI